MVAAGQARAVKLWTHRARPKVYYCRFEETYIEVPGDRNGYERAVWQAQGATLPFIPRPLHILQRSLASESVSYPHSALPDATL